MRNMINLVLLLYSFNEGVEEVLPKTCSLSLTLLHMKRDFVICTVDSIWDQNVIALYDFNGIVDIKQRHIYFTSCMTIALACRYH